MTGSRRISPVAGSTWRTSSPASPPTGSPSPPGASARAGRASGASPAPGEPRDVFEKLDDCGTVIQQLVTCHAERVAAHSLGSTRGSGGAYRARRRARPALRRDELEHLPGSAGPGAPPTSSGCLTHTDTAVRGQAVAHNLECIAARPGPGRDGAHGLDRRPGRTSPARQDFRRALERYLDSHARDLRRAFPPTGGSSSSTSCSSRPSTRPWSRTGAPAI